MSHDFYPGGMTAEGQEISRHGGGAGDNSDQYPGIVVYKITNEIFKVGHLDRGSGNGDDQAGRFRVFRINLKTAGGEFGRSKRQIKGGGEGVWGNDNFGRVRGEFFQIGGNKFLSGGPGTKV